MGPGTVRLSVCIDEKPWELMSKYVSLDRAQKLLGSLKFLPCENLYLSKNRYS